MRLLFVIGIVTLSVTVDSLATPTGARNTEPVSSDDETIRNEQFVVDLARNFSSFYFQKMTSLDDNDRIVSPLSVFIPISMMSYGTRGRTRQRFLNAIGLDKKDLWKVRLGYKNLVNKVAKYDVRIKTKIYVPSNAKPTFKFGHLSSNVFNAEIEYVDFNNGSTAGRKINEWVAAQTNNNVTELFKPQQIGHDLSIVIVNTVYFKGTWAKAFDSSRTALRPFHPVHGRSIDVPTMCVVGRFRHGRLDDDHASFIELPYKSKGRGMAMSMFIILPDVEPHQNQLYLGYRFRNMNLSKLLNSTEDRLEVHLPQFKIESELSLNKVLDTILRPALLLGKNRIRSLPWTRDPLQRMFASLDSVMKQKEIERYALDTTDFSGIFTSSKQSNLSESAMKIVIDVNEEGVEAAESSGMPYNTIEPEPSDRKIRSAASKTMQFVVDRPFVALIAIKRKILTDIFSIYVGGRQFVPEESSFE